MQRMLQNGPAVDELDRVPSNFRVSNLDILAFCISILSHLVDVGIDINIAVRYYLKQEILYFGLTVLFLLFPAIVNTAVSIQMYSQDKVKDEHESFSKRITTRNTFRIFVLVFQMAPILRYWDALRYAWKSRRAEQANDKSGKREWYRKMLKEDSDASLLRAFECFLEAAPQQVLQLSLMIEGREEFQVHQILSVASSCVSMAWCLAGYQRAVRYAQEDKDNISYIGTSFQILWHFFVTVSRIMSIAILAYLYPLWCAVACCVHVIFMTGWLYFGEKNNFCKGCFTKFLFSIVLGLVYLFTYILPVEGKTRRRYFIFYTLCFIEDVSCVILWILFANSTVQNSWFFIPVIIISIVPFIVGILFMISYYVCFHPKMGRLSKEKMEQRSQNSAPVTAETNLNL